jgi:hypothetical protein
LVASRSCWMILLATPSSCLSRRAAADARVDPRGQGVALACSGDRQASVPQERVGQMWRPPDAVDAAVGLVDHLGQGSPGTVGQLDGLEAGPAPRRGSSSAARGGQGFKSPQLHPVELTEMVDTLVSNQRGDRMSEPLARGVTSYRGRRRAWMTACSRAAFMMPLPASSPAQPGAGPRACFGVSFFGSMKGFSTTTARTRSVGVSTSRVVPRSVRPIGSIA